MVEGKLTKKTVRRAKKFLLLGMELGSCSQDNCLLALDLQKPEPVISHSWIGIGTPPTRMFIIKRPPPFSLHQTEVCYKYFLWDYFSDLTSIFKSMTYIQINFVRGIKFRERCSGFFSICIYTCLRLTSFFFLFELFAQLY